MIAGDRVDILESRITALLHGRPDNPVTETGVLREFKNSAYRTRFSQHRADLKHLPLDGVLLRRELPIAAAALADFREVA